MLAFIRFIMSVKKYDLLIRKGVFADAIQDSTFSIPARIQKCLT